MAFVFDASLPLREVVVGACEGVGEDDFGCCCCGGVLALPGFDLRAHERGVEGLHYDHVAHSTGTAASSILADDFALRVSDAAFLQ